jgi:hypothetical protein
VEDFQWLLKEILSEGAEGWIVRVSVLAGSTDDSLQESFRKLRSADYRGTQPCDNLHPFLDVLHSGITDRLVSPRGVIADPVPLIPMFKVTGHNVRPRDASVVFCRTVGRGQQP